MEDHAGKKFRTHRISLGLTQMEAAEKARLSQAAISQFERRGTAKTETYRKLRAAFGLDLNELIGSAA